VSRTPEDHWITERQLVVNSCPGADASTHLSLIRILASQSPLTHLSPTRLHGRVWRVNCDQCHENSLEMQRPDNSARARDHLANERTFLAWLRTGLAVVVFGFAIGRFAIAIQQFMKPENHPQSATRMSVWFGQVAIVTGIVVVFAALRRYRRIRAQLEIGEFEPAGLLIDLVAIFAVVFGLTLAVYLVYIQASH